MDQATKRFITAYNDIDALLRRLCKAPAKVAFRALVTLGSAKNAAVRSYSHDLWEFGDLRNAITHRYRNDEPIATPYVTVVERLEAIRAVLNSPPEIGELFSKPVETCELNDPIGSVATRMFTSDYSQVPTYQRQRLVGLLTTDTIARWMAFCLQQNDGILEEAPVKSVLEHTEDPDNYMLLDPKDTVFDALEHFADFHRRGKRLAAIIIAHGGSKAKTPLGMMTSSDIPAVHEAVTECGCK